MRAPPPDGAVRQDDAEAASPASGAEGISTDADAVRDVLRELAERAEFQPPPPDLAERFWTWLFGLLDRLGLAWPGGGLDATLLGWVLLALLVGALIVAIVAVLRTFRARVRRRVAATPATAPAAEVSPEAWLTTADAAWSARRAREAFGALYTAGVLGLGARGLLRLAPSKLAGAYRRELASHPDESAPFTRLAADFYAVVFGGRSVADERYARARADAARLVDAQPPQTPAEVA